MPVGAIHIPSVWTWGSNHSPTPAGSIVQTACRIVVTPFRSSTALAAWLNKVFSCDLQYLMHSETNERRRATALSWCKANITPTPIA